MQRCRPPRMKGKLKTCCQSRVQLPKHQPATQLRRQRKMIRSTRNQLANITRSLRRKQYSTSYMVISILKYDLEARLECRERKKSLLQFDDTWHLFFPRDIVYDPKLDQALQVLCVQNGREILDLFPDQNDSSPQLQCSKNPLSVLTFSIDSTAKRLGQLNVHTASSHGRVSKPSPRCQSTPSSTRLPSSQRQPSGSSTVRLTKKEALQARGHKFCEIVNTPQVAHRQYQGFDIRKVREQVSACSWPHRYTR